MELGRYLGPTNQTGTRTPEGQNSKRATKTTTMVLPKNKMEEIRYGKFLVRKVSGKKIFLLSSEITTSDRDAPEPLRRIISETKQNKNRGPKKFF